MIAVLDYGVGNLFSLCASLRAVGADVTVTDSPLELKKAHSIVLPGVGAFGDARRKLEQRELIQPILAEVKQGKPLLGICLGMQLLFEKSEEYGTHRGLGLIRGDIEQIGKGTNFCEKIPHMGWNSLHFMRNSPIFRYVQEGEYVYYVHSYHGVRCAEDTVATSDYGVTITGAVQRDNVYGTQFHPEKSGKTGLNILRAFAELR